MVCLTVASATAAAQQIDPVGTQLGFETRTRYGQRLTGRFPVFDGRLETLADGRQRLSLRLDAGKAYFPKNEIYNRMLLGDGFFAVAQFPDITFVTNAYSPSIATTGGQVEGQLTLRGITETVVLQVAPATCEHPGYHCPVIGRGEVSRVKHGMDGWQWAVSDRVVFVFQVRLLGVDPS